MDLPVFEKAAYVVRYRGERERFEKGEIDDPVTAIIKPLTVAERREMAGRMGRPGDGRSLDEMGRRIFCDHVTAIENLRIGGEAIVTGEQLYDHPHADYELIDEIQEAVLRRSRLEEGAKKNWSGR